MLTRPAPHVILVWQGIAIISHQVSCRLSIPTPLGSRSPHLLGLSPALVALLTQRSWDRDPPPQLHPDRLLPRLITLGLSGCVLKDNGLSALMSALRGYATLRALDLSRNSIGPQVRLSSQWSVVKRSQVIASQGQTSVVRRRRSEFRGRRSEARGQTRNLIGSQVGISDMRPIAHAGVGTD